MRAGGSNPGVRRIVCASDSPHRLTECTKRIGHHGGTACERVRVRHDSIENRPQPSPQLEGTSHRVLCVQLSCSWEICGDDGRRQVPSLCPDLYEIQTGEWFRTAPHSSDTIQHCEGAGSTPRAYVYAHLRAVSCTSISALRVRDTRTDRAHRARQDQSRP